MEVDDGHRVVPRPEDVDGVEALLDSIVSAAPGPEEAVLALIDEISAESAAMYARRFSPMFICSPISVSM